MSISGRLDDSGHDLALTRIVPVPAAQIWEHVSRSDGLATWYGTFSGDPATGTVQVTMTAEPGEAVAAEYTIHDCEPERLLTVSSSMGEGAWRLSLELAPATSADAATILDGTATLDATATLDGTVTLGGMADGAASAGSTQVVLCHHDVPLEMLAYVGPGWEWYLDRLTGAVTGGPIPGMDVWDSQYMTLSQEYADLAS
ncbi:hypothetical protein [Brachybacterium sp.]|uniref:hypothetical protein n=1 Tax=Brachybacterium sp. TaxID=1891286 RepID=UPI002ED41184